MVEIQVRATGGEYPVYVGHRLYEARLAEDLRSMEIGKAAVVSHPSVFDLHGRRLGKAFGEAWSGTGKLLSFFFPAGEEHKTLQTLEQGYSALIGGGFTRGDVILAFGGGVVGDLAGFLAATYMRGVRFIQVPTTLMAMVDSSIGGKVGVDLPRAKNAVGSFYQPYAVYSDVDVLSTLPEREIRSGMVEVAKYGFLYDEGLLRTMQGWPDGLPVPGQDVSEVIAACATMKAGVVGCDERDLTGVRAMLNYGHTFGHALESACGYGRLRHGEAVAVGMMVAARLSELSGLAEAGLLEHHRRVLMPLLEETRLPGGLEPEQVLTDMRSDKKREENLRFVLLESPQAPRLVEDVPEDVVKRALEEILQELRGVEK